MNLQITIHFEGDVSNLVNQLVKLGKDRDTALQMVRENAETKLCEGISRAFHKIPHTVRATATL